MGVQPRSDGALVAYLLRGTWHNDILLIYIKTPVTDRMQARLDTKEIGDCHLKEGNKRMTFQTMLGMRGSSKIRKKFCDIPVIDSVDQDLQEESEGDF